MCLRDSVDCEHFARSIMLGVLASQCSSRNGKERPGINHTHGKSRGNEE